MFRHSCWWLLAAASVAAAETARAQESHELLLFLSADYTRRTELSSTVLDQQDFTPSVDVFYTRGTDRFRLLAEGLVTDDEEELERLQFGWQLSDAMRLWVGRFHEAGSWWNTEYHHGQFLQTSISRPAIEQFEDLSGVLPSHTTGLLFEGQRQLGGGAIDLSLSAGLTGRFETEGIASLDWFDPEPHHGGGASLRLAWLPEPLSENQIALTWRGYDINVDPEAVLPVSWALVDRIDLRTFGVLADWNWGAWRLNVVGNRVRSSPRGGGGKPNTEFTASYAQVERRVKESWVLYARVEHTSGEEDYLDLFPRYARGQSVAGGKWLIAKRHALSIEASNAKIAGDHLHAVAIQWSAVLP